MEWKDTTTYSRDDKERKPTTWTIERGRLQITITCGHIHYRPDWVLHCYLLGINTVPFASGNVDLEQAKRIAINTVRDKIYDLKTQIDSICRFEGIDSE